MRSAFRTQQLPVFVRMLDKDSAWGRDENGLRSVIPTALAFAVAGYPFVVPDAVAGSGYPYVGGVTPADRELYVRWVELAAFMPAMRFGVPPWQYDDDTVAIARRYAHLHQTAIGNELLAAARDAVLHGM